MSYIISYEKESKNKGRKGISFFTAVLVCVLLLGGILNQFAPKQTLEILFPWKSEAARQAFHSFQQNLQQGISFPEALESFCTEIITNGKTEYLS